MGSVVQLGQRMKAVKQATEGPQPVKALQHEGLKKKKPQSLSRVRLFATPQNIALQVPLFMDSPGKNTGVGCHALLQGIFQTQGSNPQLTPASPELQADS